jgi:hypothetical protein
MPFQIVEELRTHNPSIILNSLEEAKDVLILNNWTVEETIEFLDTNGWDIWFNNRESLLNSFNSVTLDWDQESQILKRTLVFENEELFDEYRYMCNSIFPAHDRQLVLKEAVDV